MSAMQIFFYALVYGAAFGFALLLVLMLGGAIAFTSRFERYVFPAIFLCLIVAGGVSTLLSGRDLSLLGMYLNYTGGDITSFMGRMTQRMFTIAALALCAALMLARFLNPGKRRSLEARPLLVGYLLYFFTNVVVNSLFGTQPAFSYNHFYQLPVVLALFMGYRLDPQLAERSVKTLLVVYLSISLLTAMILPHVALQTGYSGLIPGFSLRLWGVAPHANVLAPVALVVLLLEYSRPYASRFWHRLALVIALAVLVLAQSKTTWAAALAAAGVVALVRFGQRFSQAFSGKAEGILMTKVALGLALPTLFVGGLAAIFFLDPESLWSHVMLSEAGDSVESMSGRMVIWQAAIDEWQRNLTFGYGPNIWDLEYRMKMLLVSAFHAHNLFLQSLSSAGLIGLAGLLVYLGVLGRGAWRTMGASSGATLAMFVVLLFRAMTEVPLPTQSIISPDFLVHLALVVAILNSLSVAASSQAAAKATVAPRPAGGNVLPSTT